MSKVELHPLFTGVRKRLGDIVFVNLEGETFARKYVKAHNPNTPAQIEVRESFKKLAADWKMMTGILQRSWKAQAKKKKRLKGYSAYIGANAKRQRAGEPLQLTQALGIDETLPFTPHPGTVGGEILLTFSKVPGGYYLIIFSQIRQDGRAVGPLICHDAGIDPDCPFHISGLESGQEYYLYALLADAPCESASRISASTEGLCQAG